MHDHPEKIHEVMQMVTDALIDWVRQQKIVAAYIAPAITLSGGKYADANRDRLATGKVIERAIRKYNREG